MDWNQTSKYVDYLVFCSCRLEPSLSAVLTQHWNIRWNIYVHKLIIKPLETYISISVNRRPNQQYQGRSRRQIHWRWSHSRCNRSHRDMRISRGIPVIDILWYNFSCWRYSGHVTTSRAPRLTSFTSIIKIAFHASLKMKNALAWCWFTWIETAFFGLCMFLNWLDCFSPSWNTW